jgi:hypothetical protein
MQAVGGRLYSVDSGRLIETDTIRESCSWQKQIVTEVSTGSCDESAEVHKMWSHVTCVLLWLKSHSHHHISGGALTPYSGFGSSQGRDKEWIGYLHTGYLKGLHKDSRTL